MPPSAPQSVQTGSLQAASLQAQTLRAFTVLHHLRSDWGGQLILSLGLGRRGSALALASNIAGAVCLSLEEDPATAHAALRSGACDFVVNTLDEALRALKNEVRKHLPISVGLQGNRAYILAELLERGVAPLLLSDFTGDPANQPAIQALHVQGTQVLDFGGEISAGSALSAEALLQEVVEKNQWNLETFPLPTSSALRAFDSEILAAIPADDALRTHWLHGAPRVLPRESPPHRSLWLTRTEAQVLKKSEAAEAAR